jgi:hypothetical protein
MKKIILLALTLILAACSQGASAELDQNIEKWEQANVSHYSYTLFISCFCAFTEDMPLSIEVENGEVISITRADGSIVDPADPALETYTQYSTIDRIFSELQADLNGGADEVIVTYDATYGHPVTIAIDHIKEAIDDEISLEISNFTVLE